MRTTGGGEPENTRVCASGPTQMLLKLLILGGTTGEALSLGPIHWAEGASYTQTLSKSLRKSSATFSSLLTLLLHKEGKLVQRTQGWGRSLETFFRGGSFLPTFATPLSKISSLPS